MLIQISSAEAQASAREHRKEGWAECSILITLGLVGHGKFEASLVCVPSSRPAGMGVEGGTQCFSLKTSKK